MESGRTSLMQPDHAFTFGLSLLWDYSHTWLGVCPMHDRTPNVCQKQRPGFGNIVRFPLEVTFI